MLLSSHCHCPGRDSCHWVGLPRCVSDPVSVSLRGSLSVAKVTRVCVSGLVSFGVTVCVCSPCATPSPKSGLPGPCLLCPQPMISALPGEGLTLQSVQPAVHRMFPRRCLRRHPLPLATLGSGPRRPGQRGWGCSVGWGGGLSGPRNEGGRWGGNGPNRFRLIPAPPLTSWVPAWGRGWTG